MAVQKTIRVRGSRWEAIEKKAWQLSIKADKVIKPTDVADAILSKYVNEITAEDIEEEIKKR